ncbi:MAG: DUF1472 domain-containing protein [Chloroflexi bacterium]|nr:DUF1472 domain-containing protein [Chloroflexota bacterium]MDL1886082.1 DUF1472 domain-containing protein [Anaerolineae bacterium CFX8]
MSTSCGWQYSVSWTARSPRNGGCTIMRRCGRSCLRRINRATIRALLPAMRAAGEIPPLRLTSRALLVRLVVGW